MQLKVTHRFKTDSSKGYLLDDGQVLLSNQSETALAQLTPTGFHLQETFEDEILLKANNEQGVFITKKRNSEGLGLQVRNLGGSLIETVSFIAMEIYDANLIKDTSFEMEIYEADYYKGRLMCLADGLFFFTESDRLVTTEFYDVAMGLKVEEDSLFLAGIDQETLWITLFDEIEKIDFGQIEQIESMMEYAYEKDEERFWGDSRFITGLDFHSNLFASIVENKIRCVSIPPREPVDNSKNYTVSKHLLFSKEAFKKTQFRLSVLTRDIVCVSADKTVYFLHTQTLETMARITLSHMVSFISVNTLLRKVCCFGDGQFTRIQVTL